MAAISKCPACGALRQSFDAICPECNYEFTDIEVSGTLEKFNDKIEEYDRLISSETPESSKTGFWIVVGWIFFFPFMFGYYMFKKLKAKDAALTGNEKLKSEAILNFAVPNSRNDLIEFALLIESKVKPLTYMNALTNSGMNIQKWNNVWNEKAGHLLKKSEFALSEDQRTLSKLQECKSNIDKVISQNNKMQLMMMGLLALTFIFFLILMSLGQR